MNILIIGLGSLGLRHLQSLKDLYKLENFFFIDKRKSVDFLSDLESYGASSANFFKSIDELPRIFYDFIIVATTADERGKLLSSISKELDFGNIILEKPLTNTISDLNKFSEINKGKIFVNHHRRYQELHRYVSNINLEANKIRYESANLGLLCNFTHHVDFARMIIGNEAKIIDIQCDFTSVFESKRIGYFEVNGVLSIKFSNGCILEIANIEESTFGNDRVVEIFSNSGLYKINDSKGELVGPDSLKKNAPFFRQSELTSRYLGDIQNGVCKLPTLSQCLIDFKSILPVVENSVLFLLKQKGLLLENKKGYFT